MAWKERLKTQFPQAVKVYEIIRSTMWALQVWVRRKYAAVFRTTSDLNYIYNKNYFDMTIQKEAPSADAVVKILVEQFQPKSVIDIGCGVGIYLKAFQKFGIEIHGCDGSDTAISKNLVEQKDLEKIDLRYPKSFERRWDLCICFEVAEHLPKRYAEILVRTLTQSSDKIAFTAAPPGQGGTDHVNEQPQSYWIALFDKYEFNYAENLWCRLRNRMREKEVVSWIHQNLMIFIKR